MTAKTQAETTAAQRRQSIASDVKAFLDAGNRIETIPSGVSAQDPQGRTRSAWATRSRS